jgi:hypothetical protein
MCAMLAPNIGTQHRVGPGGSSVERCEECGELVAENEAVEVVGYGMATETGVFHAICWENYDERLNNRPAGSRPMPRWQRKPKPGMP